MLFLPRAGWVAFLSRETEINDNVNDLAAPLGSGLLSWHSIFP